MGPISGTRESVDVVVIGAGLSGLQAALTIQAMGFSCAVVEAIDRVRGKTLTLASKKSVPGVNNIGAAWINDTTQSEMYTARPTLRAPGGGSDGQRKRCLGA
jgi:monoamine oxidase